MAWRLHLIEPPEHLYGHMPDKVSAVWPADHAGEQGYYVVLPDGAIWHTCEYAGGTGNQWKVTMPGGDPLRMTVEPSINVARGWHGWIKDGVISDDVSGKRFD